MTFIKDRAIFDLAAFGALTPPNPQGHLNRAPFQAKIARRGIRQSLRGALRTPFVAARSGM